MVNSGAEDGICVSSECPKQDWNNHLWNKICEKYRFSNLEVLFSSFGPPSSKQIWTCWKQYSVGPPRYSKDWSSSPMRRGKILNCSDWRRGCLGVSHECPYMYLRRVQREWSQTLLSDAQTQSKRLSEQTEPRMCPLNTRKHFHAI